MAEAKQLGHVWWFNYTTHLRNQLSAAEKAYALAPLPQAPLFTMSCVVVKAREKSTDVIAFTVLAGFTVVQFETTLKTSIDPKPVAKSYPGKAL